MTPAEKNLILLAVPLGEASAATAKSIWLTYGCDGRSTLQQKLNVLVIAGLINRREVPNPSGGFAWLYWRDTTMPVPTVHTPSTVLGAG